MNKFGVFFASKLHANMFGVGLHLLSYYKELRLFVPQFTPLFTLGNAGSALYPF